MRKTTSTLPRAAVRVGIGGWTYDDWRNGNFYPAGWPHSRELEYASRRLTTIEINSTYHGTQKPASFAKWRDESPDGFVFSVKASRFATNRRVLADAGESIERFIGSGLAELGAKLGPIVWQFAPTKRFEAEDFEAFLNLLPMQLDGLALRHVLDVRHPSFMCAEYLALARRHRAATVFADTDDHPSFADLTGGLVYARLMRCQADEPTGYAPEALTRWAERAAHWAAGGEPADLPRVDEPTPAAGAPREVFMFFISGAKERAPHAAMGLIECLK
jgi:uncharacterized protein YecE (DUF72 family)